MITLLERLDIKNNLKFGIPIVGLATGTLAGLGYDNIAQKNNYIDDVNSSLANNDRESIEPFQPSDLHKYASAAVGGTGGLILGNAILGDKIKKERELMYNSPRY